MSFQGIFSCKCLSASTVAQKWFFARVCLSVTFEVVLAIERKCAEIASEWSRW